MGSDLRVAIRAFATPPRMVVFGAIDFSAALARAATRDRLPRHDRRRPPGLRPEPALRRARRGRRRAGRRRTSTGPDLGPRDAILVFTHDPKFDEPALLGALGTQAGYIGALGCRRTHDDREERLRAAASRRDLDRIASPCGLDVGARTPAETAVAVLAEILALRAGRAGGRLADADGPIHSPRRAVRRR